MKQKWESLSSCKCKRKTFSRKGIRTRTVLPMEMWEGSFLKWNSKITRLREFRGSFLWRLMSLIHSTLTESLPCSRKPLLFSQEQSQPTEQTGLNSLPTLRVKKAQYHFFLKRLVLYPVEKKNESWISSHSKVSTYSWPGRCLDKNNDTLLNQILKHMLLIQFHPLPLNTYLHCATIFKYAVPFTVSISYPNSQLVVPWLKKISYISLYYLQFYL